MRAVLCFALLALLATSAVAINKSRILREAGISTVNLQTNRAVDVYGPDEVVNGVSAECRRLWMAKTIVVNQNAQGTLCPWGSFGAIIVNHTSTSGQGFSDSQGNWCGSFVESNSGGTDLNDPSAHSEIDAMRRLGNRFPYSRFNANFWGALTMYTNGESCPMDAAAQVWAGFKEVVYSVSIEDLLKLGWNQIDIDSKRVYQTAQSVANSRNLVIIEDVDFANQAPIFAWQNLPNNPCPAGCHKVAPGFCSDISPYVPKAFP